MKAAQVHPEQTQLQLVAMALAGYKGSVDVEDGSESQLWREMCAQLLPNLEDPYLKAIFLYLTGRRKLITCDHAYVIGGTTKS